MRRSDTLLVFTVAALTLCACAHAFPPEERVAFARKNQTEKINALFKAAAVEYPARELYLRAFKDEGELELWAGPGKGAPLKKITTFSICMKSGDLGPKRQQGDGQVPEGFYKVDRFNARSNFHLSLGINYPNDSDRLRGKKGTRLGGDIFIHGSCVTIGCLPIRDEYIEQLYVIALDAKVAGARELPVHIFPRRLDSKCQADLEEDSDGDKALLQFWQQLIPAYQAFEQTRRPPKVSVNPKTGAYIITPKG